VELTFEWDEIKAEDNRKKHKVSFDEAAAIFHDPFSITMPDPDHSVEEKRYIDIGCSSDGRLLMVVYTERGNDIRIISCRRATTAEKKVYHGR
jgi:uncharacterized DUF497 family protein